MTQVSLRTMVLMVKGYIKQNWGSPFIGVFILLLLVAIFYLSTGVASLADTMAVYGFYALVAGVFLQLASFLKYGINSDYEVAV
jgi:hypothetical protein